MNLNTTYLGIQLPHPLIVGSGPLGDDLDTVRELEDGGAAALVLRSLYEEEIKGEQMAAFFTLKVITNLLPKQPLILPILNPPLDQMSILNTCDA